MNNQTPPSAAPALDRGLSMIEYLLEINQPASLKKISDELSIPIASAFRLIKTLAARGYVDEISSNQQLYVPGSKLFQIVQRYQLNNPLQSMAQAPLKELAAATGQTAQLALFQNRTVLYIDQAIPVNPVSIVAPMHTPIPINITAAGKIICAQLSAEEQQDLLNHETLVQKTPYSISSISALLQNIKSARQKGYATDIEEYSRGIGCIAAAVLDGLNRCVGAIGITGHIDQYRKKEIFDGNVKAVLAAAERVSRSMGYSSQRFNILKSNLKAIKCRRQQSLLSIICGKGASKLPLL